MNHQYRLRAYCSPSTLCSVALLVSTLSSCGNNKSSTAGKEPLQDSQPATSTHQDTTTAMPASRKTYAAIYEGVLPCADCQGIRTTFRIASDYQSYELIQEYLGKGVEPTLEAGKLNTERGFGKDEDATLYVLNDDQPADEQRYFVRLTNDSTHVKMLDKDRKAINSEYNYLLRKI